ncbi:hypothetical protein, partial [Bradyrhizobium sp. Mp27]|uniref:hypothetical protein n=1 Tax=Bradyrhizobium sp. Mp27 TaxID=3042157 RepID=UPI00248BF16F
TPAMTFGNWFVLFNRRQVFDAASMSLNTISFAVCCDRAGPGCLDSAPLDLSGFLPGYAERGALRFCRCVGRA